MYVQFMGYNYIKVEINIPKVDKQQLDNKPFGPRLRMGRGTFHKFELMGRSHSRWARIFRRLFSKSCTFGSKSGTKSLVRRYQAKFAKTVIDVPKVQCLFLTQKCTFLNSLLKILAQLYCYFISFPLGIFCLVL